MPNASQVASPASTSPYAAVKQSRMNATATNSAAAARRPAPAPARV